MTVGVPGATALALWTPAVRPMPTRAWPGSLKLAFGIVVVTPALAIATLRVQADGTSTRSTISFVGPERRARSGAPAVRH